MVGSIVSVIQEDMVLEKDQRVLQFDSQAAEGDCGHSGCSLSMRLQSPTPRRHTSFSNATLSNSATPCGQAFKHIRLWGPLPFKPPHRGFTISFKDLPNDLKSFPLVFTLLPPPNGTWRPSLLIDELLGDRKTSERRCRGYFVAIGPIGWNSHSRGLGFWS